MPDLLHPPRYDIDFFTYKQRPQKAKLVAMHVSRDEKDTERKVGRRVHRREMIDNSQKTARRWEVLSKCTNSPIPGKWRCYSPYRLLDATVLHHLDTVRHIDTYAAFCKKKRTTLKDECFTGRTKKKTGTAVLSYQRSLA
ncbi:hypothetical protein Trydic_g18141 [Trypoxylus dichotomus]